MNAILRDVKDMLFPPKCVSCGAALGSDEEALCPECAHIFQAERALACPECGRPHGFCRCIIHYEGFTFPLVHVTGYDIKRGSVSKNIVLKLKDEPISAGFSLTALLLYSVLSERIYEFSDALPSECIYTWIPRSEKAKRKAGHDQSQRTAEAVSALAGGKPAELFFSTSSSQQKTLSKEKRMNNAKKNYIILPHEDLYGKTVVIIDDIVTSGASLGVCGKLAKKAGAARVIALAFAKTDSRHDRTANKDAELNIF